jgi:hypothetical protein
LHLFLQSKCRKDIHTNNENSELDVAGGMARLDIISLLDAVHRAGVSDFIPCVRVRACLPSSSSFRHESREEDISRMSADSLRLAPDGS